MSNEWPDSDLRHVFSPSARSEDVCTICMKPLGHADHVSEERRSQLATAYDSVAAKIAEVKEAGFVFDPTGSGRERYTHQELGLTVIRQPYMNKLQWVSALHGAANRARACRVAAATKERDRGPL